MNLLLTMLPVYLLGNLHCIGMCGPLVMMLGKHRYRYLYFAGRTLSFSLAGLIAGSLGAVMQQVVQAYHVPALTSVVFGGVILYIGFTNLTGWTLPLVAAAGNLLKPFQQPLSMLLLQDLPHTTFLFGFFTVFLPCGQTVMVFSACALAGSGAVGFLNGFAFALLTTPSLLMAMEAHKLFTRIKRYYNLLLGISALIIGSFSIYRGFITY